MRIQNKREKNECENALQALFHYGEWVLIVNVCTITVLLYLIGMQGVLAEAFLSFSFSLKYVVISLAFACILPYIVEIIGKYFSITFSAQEKIQNEK